MSSEKEENYDGFIKIIYLEKENDNGCMKITFLQKDEKEYGCF